MTQDESQSLFRLEYQRELEQWLRRRFRLFAITCLAVTVGHLLLTAFFSADMTAGERTIVIISRLAMILVIGHYVLGRNLASASRRQILAAATVMILVLGLISLLAVLGISLREPDKAPNLILPIFLWHLSACLFLPWTPRESLRPFLPLMLAWGLLVLIFSTQADLFDRVLTVVFGPGVLLPGLGLAAWRMARHSRSFRTRMVGKQFLSMRREFGQARAIHESLFPTPYNDGFVRFEFTYHPMRDLGGDFIHLHVGPEGLLHLALIDVTGHGLAAALTVNRLYGELERIRAECPRAEPGEVLALLNRYVHLTMARHSIYATAACAMLDPYLGRLTWASAGHPPGYLRRVNGVVTNLDATAVVLGAVGDEQFDADSKALDLVPGDVLILYTDGAFETRDRQGRQFGLGRLRELMSLRPAPRHWPQFLTAEVGRHSGGRNEDDVLVASLTFCASRRQSAEEQPKLILSTP